VVGEVHDLLASHQPDRVVIEIGSAAGWIKDLAEAMGLTVQVANPNHDAWRWKNVKRKTDRDDALKLARLSAMNQLPTLQLPATRVRQWRSLIGYRWSLVSRRIAIKNHIRSILDRQGRLLTGRQKRLDRQDAGGAQARGTDAKGGGRRGSVAIRITPGA